MNEEQKRRVAMQIFGNILKPKVCLDLDVDCFTMTNEQIRACRQHDCTRGFCPLAPPHEKVPDL